MDFDALMPNLDILGNIVGFYGYDEPTHGMFSSSGNGGLAQLGTNLYFVGNGAFILCIL